LRVASKTTELFEYLVGAFYTHEVSEQSQHFVLQDLAGQPAPNTLFTYQVPTRYEEYAAFGDLTYHITHALDVSGGLRYSKNRQAYTQVGSGLFSLNTPTQHSSEGVVTYLGNARYHVDDHSTAYVRYATGYRPGGPNFVTVDPLTGVLPASPKFKADHLASYEVGYKTDTIGRAVGFDVAAYYINWKDIQITTFRGNFGVIVNAAGASVRGVEMTLSARPVQRLSANASLAYQDAHLTAEAPDLKGRDGERLPNVPRFTAALNADYEIATNAWQPRVGATVRYVSSREASFDNNLGVLQYRLPGYTTVDARGSFAVGSVDVQLYAHNILDERGQLSAGTGYSSFGGPAQVSIQQPRTIGFMVSTRF
jgi:outer membrane receptor protein involved in Fe transport